jgi:hypothetical protein
MEQPHERVKTEVVSSADGSLKKIAGDVLLILYALQRRLGYCDDGVVSFERRMDNRAALEQSPLGNRLLQTCSSVADVYNALRYLDEKAFISFTESCDNMAYQFFNIRVIAGGVDIIEGIERGEAEREQFFITFNIKLADTINVESLMKNEIGSIFKASVI